jgi:S1-C subfamily serine protease
MKTGRWRSALLGATLATGALLVTAPTASAQVSDQDCRCVDGDGNPIERCTCFRMPEVPEIVDGIVAFGPGRLDFDFTSARPRLGVSVSTTQDDALDAQGARVTDLLEDGPADEAGIQEGDIITGVDGRSLLSPIPGDAEESFDLDESIPVQRLLAIARDLEPGESVEVAYVRDGQPATATVEVRDLGFAVREWSRSFRQELEPQMERLRERLLEQSQEVERARERVRVLAEAQPSVFVMPGLAQEGLELIALSPGLGSYFGTDRGVLVSDVAEDSALGLRPGDVILRIGDREATSPARVRRLLATYESDEDVTFRVVRQGNQIDVLGRLGG